MAELAKTATATTFCHHVLMYSSSFATTLAAFRAIANLETALPEELNCIFLIGRFKVDVFEVGQELQLSHFVLKINK